MTSQKIPLFGGMIIPVHNGCSVDPAIIAPIPTVVGSPLDKNLKPVGVQATYEVHLWLIDSPASYGGPVENYYLNAYLDNDPLTQRTIWSLPQTALPGPTAGIPVKILDGYPVRGNTTLELTVDIPIPSAPDRYPNGPQVFGYYYRVGQGSLIQAERRFIGEASPDGITSGLPVEFAPAERKIIHIFESNHIDEISLGFTRKAEIADPSSPINIRFEDVNNNLIIPTQTKIAEVLSYPNFLKNPSSVYYLDQIPFGGGYIPRLNHIAITNNAAHPVWVHGYFTRR